jgi:Zn-dependent M16 (insulinase) family peptidase
LPSLGLKDIQRGIEFVDFDTKYIGKVKTYWFDQPTNGINYVRIKANLKNLPEHLRVFVPMFTELLSSIGNTDGLSDIYERHENLLLSIGFLDRNVEKAFECLNEVIATPNFDEPSNISDLIKMESVNKANNIGNKGLNYATSYAQSGIKAFARSFESLRSDVFFC